MRSCPPGIQRVSRPFALLLLGSALSACASDPVWLRDTVDAPFYKSALPESPIAAQAAADPDRIALIEQAATRSYPKAENPDLPHWQIEKLVWALWFNSRDNTYTDLARRLAAADPARYNALRAMLIAQSPIELCEAELLPIAFWVLPADASEPARHGRSTAARLLVQKCALESRELPRTVPHGPPLRMQPDDSDRHCRADQWALVAAYGGHSPVALKKMEAWITQDQPEDHDRAELETIAARLRGEHR